LSWDLAGISQSSTPVNDPGIIRSTSVLPELFVLFVWHVTCFDMLWHALTVCFSDNRLELQILHRGAVEMSTGRPRSLSHLDDSQKWWQKITSLAHGTTCQQTPKHGVTCLEPMKCI
jgi:hypothetical protein